MMKRVSLRKFIASFLILCMAAGDTVPAFGMPELLPASGSDAVETMSVAAFDDMIPQNTPSEMEAAEAVEGEFCEAATPSEATEDAALLGAIPTQYWGITEGGELILSRQQISKPCVVSGTWTASDTSFPWNLQTYYQYHYSTVTVGTSSSDTVILPERCYMVFYRSPVGGVSSGNTVTSVTFNAVDTSSVTSMEEMFYAVEASTLDISKFNTSGVTTMKGMFDYCDELTGITFGSGFSTANVTSMDSMFAYCYKLANIDLSRFNTAKVTTFRRMFYNCDALTSLDLSGFSTQSATSFESFLQSSFKIESVDLSTFNTTNATVTNMLTDCPHMLSIEVGSGWKKNVTFPTPGTYIVGSDGKWYTSDGTAYECNAIPTGVAATYHSQKQHVWVGFDMRGHGTQIPGAYYNGGDKITKPADPSATGYNFGGWYTTSALSTAWNFNTDLVRDAMTLYAKWTPRTDTVYTVRHYRQTVTGDGYELAESETKTGTTGAQTQAAAKTYTGFHATPFDQYTISPNGTTKVDIYYDRDIHSVTIEPNNTGWGSVSEGTMTVRYGTQIHKVGNDLTVGNSVVTATPEPNSQQFSYAFSDWSGIPVSGTVTEDQTVTAVFTCVTNTYEVTIQTNNDCGSVSDILVSAQYGAAFHAEGNILTVGDRTVTAAPNENTAQYTYQFDGWDGVSDVDQLTGNTTVTANFSRTVNPYQVTVSVNEEDLDYGTVTSSGMTVDYGTPLRTDGAVLYVGEVPITAVPATDTAQYDFEFAGWTEIPGEVTGNIEIVASFTQNDQYYDISIASSNTEYGTVDTASLPHVIYGTEISADNETGVLTIGGQEIHATATEGTAQYEYTFVEWDGVPESGIVESALNITAIFQRSVNSYKVHFATENTDCGSFDRTVVTAEYGTEISVDENNENWLHVGNVIVKAMPKAEDPEYTYSFTGWIGIPEGGTTVTGETNISASFSKTKRIYSIHVKTGIEEEPGSGSELDWTAEYGTPIVEDPENRRIIWVGETGAEASEAWVKDSQFVYYFQRWEPNSGIVTGDTVIRAVFTKQLQRYDVVIRVNVSGYGTVSKDRITAEYGDDIVIEGSVIKVGDIQVTAFPTERDQQYTYRFKKWTVTPQTNKVKGSTTITAEFERVENEYVVSFDVSDSSCGSVDTASYTVKYGTNIRISGSDVIIGGGEGQKTVKAVLETDNEYYTYQFTGWSGVPADGKITDDTQITALMSKTTVPYVITFESADPAFGTISATSLTVPYGTAIEENENELKIGTTKVTADPAVGTDQYTYEFDAWQNLPSGGIITEDITIRAGFTRKTNQYIVSFAADPVGYGNFSQEEVMVPYGTKITFSGNVASMGAANVTAIPKAQDAMYTYYFDGWEDAGTETEVQGDLTVTAKFHSEPVIYDILVTVNADEYGTVSKDQVQVYYGTPISANGAVLTIGDTEVTAIPSPKNEGSEFSFMEWRGIPAGGIVTEGTEITAVFEKTTRSYRVTVTSSNTNYGTVSKSFDEMVLYGTPVTVSDKTLTIGEETITASEAEYTDTIVYNFDGWENVPGSRKVDGELSIVAAFSETERKYTISIEIGSSGGGTVSCRELKVPFGTSVSASGNVLTAGDQTATATAAPMTDQYTYAFSGWSGVPKDPVKADTTITAVFTSTLRTYTVSLDVNDRSMGAVDYAQFSAKYGSVVSVSGSSLLLGGEIVATATPAPPDQEKIYTLGDWLDDSGKEITSSISITGNTSLTYRFNYQKVIYPVHISVDLASEGMGSVVGPAVVDAFYNTSITPVAADEKQLSIGGTIVTASPSEVDEAHKEQYSYQFAGWKGIPAERKVREETYITALFEKVYIPYEVEIVSGNTGYGTVSKDTVIVPYGAVIGVAKEDANTIIIGETAVTAVPSDDTAQYDYEFTGWTGIPVEGFVGSKIRVTAEFSRTVRTYDISAVTDGSGYGTVTGEKVTVEYGTPITVKGTSVCVGDSSDPWKFTAVPNKETAQYMYRLKAWKMGTQGEIVTEDTVLTAVFERITKTYTVEISAADTYGTVSTNRVTVPYGTKITVNGSSLKIGTKTVTAVPAGKTAQYTYSFGSWNGLGNGTVTGNMRVTASFVRSLNRYRIVWSAGEGIFADGTKVKEAMCDYGTLPEKPDAPSKASTAYYTYTFDRWTPDITAVTGEATYLAVYSAAEISGGGGSGGGGGGGGGGSSGGGGGSSGGGGGSSGGGGGSSGGGGGSSGGGGPTAKKTATPAAGGATFSPYWYADAAGVWRIRNKAGAIVTNAWLCDDAVTANGQSVWYLLGADGSMLSQGLVQDQSGNYYSLETNHNGYYGMLRYQNGVYNCNGQQVYLEFSQKHDGTFGAVTNADGLSKLMAIYGVTQYTIGNENCVYTSTF